MVRRVPIAAIEHVQLAMPPGMENAAREFYQGVLGTKASALGTARWSVVRTRIAEDSCEC